MKGAKIKRDSLKPKAKHIKKKQPPVAELQDQSRTLLEEKAWMKGPGKKPAVCGCLRLRSFSLPW